MARNENNGISFPAEPDAHGQAALLLAESTLHALVDRAAISNADAIAIVRNAAEVKVEVAEAAGESAVRMNESLALLEAIAASLAADGIRPAVLKGVPASRR